MTKKKAILTGKASFVFVFKLSILQQLFWQRT